MESSTQYTEEQLLNLVSLANSADRSAGDALPLEAHLPVKKDENGVWITLPPMSVDATHFLHFDAQILSEPELRSQAAALKISEMNQTEGAADQ